MWDFFIKSIKEFFTAEDSSNYFMGCLIFQKDESNSSNDTQKIKHKIIVDGQQRLTTMILFAKAICDEEFFTEKFNEENKNSFLSSRFEEDRKALGDIILYGGSGINHNNENTAICKCYKYFCGAFSKEEFYKNNYEKILNEIKFVIVDLSIKENAQKVFDTINTVGTKLTTAEIIKNYLFLGKENEIITEYNLFWVNVFEGRSCDFWKQEFYAGRGTKSNIEFFLQAFHDIYNPLSQKTHYSKLKSLADKYKLFFNEIKIKENKENRENFLNSMKKYAEIYYENINLKATEGTLNFSSALDRFNYLMSSLNITSPLPYILWIFKTIKFNDEREKIIFQLENYLMRRALCKEKYSDYPKIFHSFIHKLNISSCKDLNKYLLETEHKSIASRRYPDNDLLAEYLSGANGAISSKVLRLALYFIELSYHDEAMLQIIPLSKCNLEHLLPKKWQEHWKEFADDFNGNANLNKASTGIYVNSFGNLTLLTNKLGVGIGNLDWETKKKGVGKKKGLLECAGDIRTLRNYLDIDKWNYVSIDRRREFLLRKVEEIWPLSANLKISE